MASFGGAGALLFGEELAAQSRDALHILLRCNSPRGVENFAGGAKALGDSRKTRQIRGVVVSTNRFVLLQFLFYMCLFTVWIFPLLKPPPCEIPQEKEIGLKDFY